MKNSYSKYIIFALCVAFSSLAFITKRPVTPLFQKLLDTFQSYSQKFAEERIYLQLDKPFYEPKDIIWIKGNLLDAKHLKDSTQSEVVHVELINPKGDVEQKLDIKTIQGHINGSLELSENATGGLYKIRAYTKWIRNFELKDAFEREIFVQKVITQRVLFKLDFIKKAYGKGDIVEANIKIRNAEDLPLKNYPITIGLYIDGEKRGNNKTLVLDEKGEGKASIQLPNSLQSTDAYLLFSVKYEGSQESFMRKVPIVLNHIKIRFLPEGGNLIADQPQNIAFKAVNEYGKPADISGIVLDAKGQEVTSFSSFHQGMGALKYIPKFGKKYRVKLTQPSGISTLYTLPKAQKNGYCLQLDSAYKEHVSLKCYIPVDNTIHVLAQIRGKEYFAQSYKVNQGWSTIKIPTQNMPIGIMQVTLFDSKMLPVSERLVFVNPHQKLNFSIKTDQKKYRPKEKITIDYKVTDHLGNGVQMDFAMAVVDDKILSLADDRQDNILSYLLMSADLKGKVDEPNFYFDPEKPKANKALDYVMMTHGWRRFTWKEIKKPTQEIRYMPDKNNILAGKLINKKTRKPIKGTVTLLEIGNQGRFLKLKTNDKGEFSFVNIDPSTRIQLAAHSNTHSAYNIDIKVDKVKSIQFSELPTSMNSMYQRSIPSIDIINKSAIKKSTSIAPANKNKENKANSISLEEDVESLQEVVVVGYGMSSKKNIAGNVINIRGISEISNNYALSQALQGTVAGIIVTPHQDSFLNKGNQLTNRQLPIKQGEGMLNHLLPNTLTNSTALDDSETDDISSFTLYNMGKLQAEYDLPYNYIQDNKTYAYKVIVPKKYYHKAREFYAPNYDVLKASQPDSIYRKRMDFRKTIYWNPYAHTDQNGEGSIFFYNADAITTYRITVEGVAPNGMVGRKEHTFASNVDFNIQTKVPAYLCEGDTLKMPIFISNNTGKKVSGQLSVKTNYLLKNEILKNLELEKDTVTKVIVPIYIKGDVTNDKLTLAFKAKNFNDELSFPLEIQKKSFPMEYSISGKKQVANFKFSEQDIIDGSLSISFQAYDNNLTSITNALSSILRDPYGCFEQVSSSNYPNIYALQLLNNSTSNNDYSSLKNNAHSYIADGYKRLKAYEIKGGGFEWYGHKPAHEGLSAYGLVQFIDMKKVYPKVEQKLIDRTTNYLLSRKDKKGGFKRNAGKYGFAAASYEVNNAYIVMALSMAGEKNIEKEFNRAHQECIKSKDTYRMSLVAKAAYHLGKKAIFTGLVEKLKSSVQKYTFNKLPAEHSLVRSYGSSLNVETTALIIQVFQLADVAHDLRSKGLNYLLSNRKYGGFGSTQATALVLQTIVNEVSQSKFDENTDYSATISVNNNPFQKFFLKPNKIGNNNIRTTIPQSSLNDKEMFSLGIQYSHKEICFPYSFDISWRTNIPPSHKNCKVDIATKLNTKVCRTGDTARLSVKLSNKKKVEGLPSTTAIVGIPSGLSLQHKQLKELQEKRIVDYLEVRKNYVILYFSEFGPAEVKNIHLDLIATVPGYYQAAASTAYEYYNNSFKDWESGEEITILPIENNDI